MKILLFIVLLFNIVQGYSWGFMAHKKINEYAIYCLPLERIKFYKPHLEIIVKNSIIPDIRKNTSISEYSLHYIDIENFPADQLHFSDSNFLNECELVDSCREHGILPWHILRVFNSLKVAIQFNKREEIVRLSSELGHYISDACVPLHTTENYDGQLTDQDGIHRLWESSLPELYFDDYNLFGIQADTIKDVEALIWNTVMESHKLKDSVLSIHRALQLQYIGESHGIIQRGNRLISDYSLNFKKDYNKKLNQMITKQLKKSILLCASLWETAWFQAREECY